MIHTPEHPSSDVPHATDRPMANHEQREPPRRQEPTTRMMLEPILTQEEKHA